MARQSGVQPAGTALPRVVLACAVLVGLLASAVMVWHSSRAAFTAKTTNPSDAWAAGSVAISDDDTGAAMFTAAGLAPGQSSTRCITVTYTGSLASSVSLYATSTSGSLAPYLNLVITDGTGGGYGSCTGYTPIDTSFNGTVSGFGAASTGYTTGVGAFAPTTGQTRTYRFITTLSAAAPDTAQGQTAAMNLQWEARSYQKITGTGSASSDYPGPFPASALADGNTSTAWSSSNNAGVQHTEWAQISMAAPATVRTVTLYPRSGFADFYPVDLAIATSTDGTTWTTVATDTGTAIPTTARSYSFPSRTAQFVRVNGLVLRQSAGDNNYYRMQLGEIILRP